MQAALFFLQYLLNARRVFTWNAEKNKNLENWREQALLCKIGLLLVSI